MLRILTTIGCIFLSTTSVAADVYQISKGVRVMMNSSLEYDQQRKLNSNYPSFVAHSQPLIENVLPKNTSQRFSGHDEVVEFFSKLPSSVKEKGLWITHAGNDHDWNQADTERIISLTKCAKNKKILMFICGGKYPKTKGTWLVAWKCTMESPNKGEQSLICEPKEKIDPSGPPLWNCSESSQ